MKMYQVDAFTKMLFKGNPAAVIVREDWLSDQLMQSIAQENNLAETAFVKIIDSENYEIRWFTPTTEVGFCGHATLASGFILFKDFTSASTIYFHVKKLGTFIVKKAEDGKIIMDFPVQPAKKIETYPSLLQQALTRPFQNVYVNEQAYIVEYAHAQDVIEEQPNLELLKTLGNWGRTTGNKEAPLDVALTARHSEYDCISRYFAPANGIEEDAVTGSIHTAIAPLWAEKLHKQHICAYQASARGGILYCELKDNQRIEVSGYAKLYLHAELYVED